MAEALQATAALLARRGFGGREGEGRGSSTPQPGGHVDRQRRRGARRTTVVLILVVLALYFGYILYAVLAGLHAGAVPHRGVRTAPHAAAPSVTPPVAPSTAPEAAPSGPPAAAPAAGQPAASAGETGSTH